MRSTRHKRKLIRSRNDYPEEKLYPNVQQRKDWDKRDYQGGVYSDSEVGGLEQSQQNPWQGSQDLAQSQEP